MPEITKDYFTNNDCYKQGNAFKPTGIMVHSTAAPGVMADAWKARWNKPGIAKCVHAFVDDRQVVQCLPWNMRGWHAGGKGNGTHIGFEICEPKDLTDKAYFAKAWDNAVELTAMLCKQYAIPVDKIIGHYEGHKQGIASNHADPRHWFPKIGKSMDDFRAEVAELLKPKPEPKPQPAPTYNYTVKRGDRLWDIAKSQLGSGLFHVQIMQLNNLRTDTIVAGQVLKLPFGDKVIHKVAKGESLYRIGKLYGVKWQDIAKRNGIGLPYIVHVGQILIIPK